MRFYTIEVQRGYSSKLDDQRYNTLVHKNWELALMEMVKEPTKRTILMCSIFGMVRNGCLEVKISSIVCTYNTPNSYLVPGIIPYAIST